MISLFFLSKGRSRRGPDGKKKREEEDYSLDNMSGFVLLGAADNQIFWPVHEFSREAVAAARQLGANVGTLLLQTRQIINGLSFLFPLRSDKSI